MKNIMTSVALVVAISFALPALAESGETAVADSRAALSEFWGRVEAQPENFAAAQAALRRQPAVHVHIAARANVRSDNFAAGRVHEMADHD